MKTLVGQARAAKPDIDIALANVPQRTAIGGREDLPVGRLRRPVARAARMRSSARARCRWRSSRGAIASLAVSVAKQAACRRRR
jgi:tetraacyldisaccharide-1-P 4'-kinase